MPMPTAPSRSTCSKAGSEKRVRDCPSGAVVATEKRNAAREAPSTIKTQRCARCKGRAARKSSVFPSMNQLQRRTVEIPADVEEQRNSGTIHGESHKDTAF